MAKGRGDRAKARALYVFERKSMPTVAAEIGVSAATVGRWKKAASEAGDDWSMARSAHLVAGEGLDSTFAVLVEQVAIHGQVTMRQLEADKEMTAKERVDVMVKLADAMTKTASATKSLAPKISELGVAQDVIQRLLEFVREHHPEHAAAILEVIEPFGETVAKAYG